MPGYNRTGPMGGGPRTGRGMGLCNAPDDVYRNFRPGPNLGSRRDLGRGSGTAETGFRGSRFARRNQNIGSYTSGELTGEIEMLKFQADAMQNTLDAINKRMEALEKAND